MSKKKKYVVMGGFAFAEESDMKKLKRYAREGWILDGVSMPILSYRLLKGSPEDLEFSVDYQTEVDQDYFQLFESAGWKHVCSISGEIHIFSAPEGTKPIYTDTSTELEKIETVQKDLKKASIYGLAVFLAIVLANLLLSFEGIVYYISIVIALWALIFTWMPFIGYRIKIRKLKKIANKNF
ncbi:MAG TPA: DUF2812 domain-containing protein [Eubacteriaceae bacterium]|nr:DUF2812 domain-containing protein [Eubacteriaceae bacterium]